MANDEMIQKLAESEYAALRKEITNAVVETWALERYAVLSSAAIWTWLLVQPASKPWIGFAKYLPFIVCVFAAGRSAVLLWDILLHSHYIRGVEKRFGDAKVFYWESFIRHRRSYLGATAAVIWLVLIAGNLIAAFEVNETWLSKAP